MSFKSSKNSERSRRLSVPPGSLPIGRNPASAYASQETRKLIVGRDIALSGEINACDHLIVEGNVEAKVCDGRKIEITEDGLFKGSADIVEADIAGKFEGDLTVSGLLTVRSTGHVGGKIQYGQLAVEAGGQLEGQLSWSSTPDSSTDDESVFSSSGKGDGEKAV